MYQIQLNNDVFFKWLLSSDDESSRYLLDVIIKGVTGIDCQSLKVLNPDIIPDYNLSKEIILDVLVEDHMGRKIDIEMQMTRLSQFHMKRFLYYGCRMISNQLKKGEGYDQLHEVFHIIFIDENLKNMMEIYTLKNEENQEYEGNLLHICFISMPYLNKAKKDIHMMNELELLVYMFKNNLNNDILKVDKKVVDIMEHKFQTFTEEEKIAYYAMQRELGRQDIQNQIKEGREKALKEGHEEGLHQGLQQGLQQGLHQGLQQGERQGSLNIVKKLFKEYYPDESMDIIENCTQKQLEDISIMIFNHQTIEEIKNYLK